LLGEIVNFDREMNDCSSHAACAFPGFRVMAR
jgi:hypothetical protein